jgi:cbb3-type cytochrome oxidase subunit 3
MDTTIIFTLVLSAFFLGGILWLVIHSRRQQGAAVLAQRAETDGKDVPGRRESGGKKTG